MIQDILSRGKSDRERYLSTTRILGGLTFNILNDTKDNCEEVSQSLGADCIDSLASKLIKSIFPFGQKFYRLYSDEEFENKEDVLIGVEDEILKEIGNTTLRQKLSIILDHLLLSGNILLDLTGEEPNYYDLSEYIVNRRDTGEWYQIIIERKIIILPSDTSHYAKYIKGLGENDNNEYEFYVKIDKTDKNIYSVTEYINDIEVTETKKKGLKDLAIYPIRLKEEAGKNYSFGYALKHIGDLKSYDTFSKVLNKNLIISSKNINLVNPSSHLANNLKELASAENGDFVVGLEGDITPYNSGMEYKSDWIDRHMERLERRLSMAFLRGNGVVRDSSSTTAYEVQTLIREMSEKFGGFYSSLSKSLQQPIFTYIMDRMDFQIIGKDKKVKVEFLDGVSDLRDFQNLQKISQLVPLEALYNGGLMNYVSTEKAFRHYAEFIGLRADDLLKDKEELQAEQQAQISQAMTQAKIQQQTGEKTQ